MTCTGTYAEWCADWYDADMMRTRRRTIQRGLQRARNGSFACSAAVAGTARRGNADPRTAPGSRSGIGTLTWA